MGGAYVFVAITLKYSICVHSQRYLLTGSPLVRFSTTGHVICAVVQNPSCTVTYVDDVGHHLNADWLIS